MRVFVPSAALAATEPSTVSLAPTSLSSIAETAGTLTAAYADSGGYAALTKVQVCVGANGLPATSLYAEYLPATKLLYLFNASNVAVGGFAPGSDNVISTPLGSLNCAATTVSGSGDDLTVVWSITPSNALKGTQTTYLQASDAGTTGAWKSYGTWTVAASVPSDASLTPAALSSDAGTGEVLTGTYADTAGFGALTQVQLCVGANGSPATSLYAEYLPATNLLYLFNSSDVAIGGYAPGSSNVISTGLGSLYCAACAVSKSGNDLTVHWSFTPGSALVGAQSTYLQASDAGTMGSWKKFGTWTIVAQPTLSSVSVNPAAVAGGNSATGTVTIGAAALTGGVKVKLASNSTSVTVPNSVVVADGADSTSFTATSAPVTVKTNLTLTVTLGAVSKTTVLTVDPPVPASLTLSPSTVVHGNSATGTVTLGSAAPTGGQAVTLKSSATNATVPASVTVAAGAKTATFTVKTTSATGTATISASANGTTVSAAMTVSAAPGVPSITITEAGSEETYEAWEAVANADSYNLERGTSASGPFTVIASVPNVANSLITNYDKTGLTNGTTYYYRVASVAGSLSSAYSATVAITPTAVLAPAGLTISAYPGFNYLQFNLSNQGYNSFNLYRSTTSGGPYTKLASPTFTDYGDTTGVAGTTYYYVITRVLGLTESAYSPQVSAKFVSITLPPVSVTPGAASVTVAFPNTFYGAAPFAQYYEIFRATAAAGTYSFVGGGACTGVASISFANTGLTNGTTYYYEVSLGEAYDLEGDSIYSPNTAPKSATPLATLALDAVTKPSGLRD